EKLRLYYAIFPEADACVNTNLAEHGGQRLGLGPPQLDGVDSEGKGLPVAVQDAVAVAVGPAGLFEQSQGHVGVVGVRLQILVDVVVEGRERARQRHGATAVDRLDEQVFVYRVVQRVPDVDVFKERIAHVELQPDRLGAGGGLHVHP